MKKESPTRKAAVALARKGGFWDSAEYIGRAEDGSNIYLCTLSTPACLGLPAFIKALNGKAHDVTQGTAEYDECFEALGELPE